MNQNPITPSVAGQDQSQMLQAPRGQEIPEKAPMRFSNHNLWARMGITLHTTLKEVDALLSVNTTPCETAELIRNIISEGRFSWDGESYIPESVVRQYNQENNTRYTEKDVEWEI